jgi:hypothetical protein
LGMTTKSPAGALLSFRIYKICTLLSTDIVDNDTRVAVVAGCKALLDAACATGNSCLWQGGR